jgi:hypothetical protein
MSHQIEYFLILNLLLSKAVHSLLICPISVIKEFDKIFLHSKPALFIKLNRIFAEYSSKFQKNIPAGAEDKNILLRFQYLHNTVKLLIKKLLDDSFVPDFSCLF